MSIDHGGMCSAVVYNLNYLTPCMNLSLCYIVLSNILLQYAMMI